MRRNVGAALATAGLALAATGVSAAPASASGPAQPLVVAFSGSSPVSAPGVHVRAVFGHVGAEYVDATPAGVAALRANPRVLGLRPDAPGHLDGNSYGNGKGNGHGHGSSDPCTGVVAPDSVGGAAGTAGAGAGVNVALLDTGVSDTPALNRRSGRLIDGVDTSHLSDGGPALTRGTFTDGYGHGTYLASIIAGGQVDGSGDRALGVAPGANIVVVKVADNKGNTSLLDVLAGLDWVAAHGGAIPVVNVSLSVERATGPAYGADPLTAAVAHLRASGVTVVAAAGNTPGEVGDPGDAPEALTVGAADTSTDTPAVTDFSGFASYDGISKPDVVASGAHVLGEMPKHSVIAHTHPEGACGDDGLFKGSGTSEATAVTTGEVALFLAQHPGATPLQVKASIRAAATPMSDPRAGAGLVSPVTQVVDGGSGDYGNAATGEAGFDAVSWSAVSWSGKDFTAADWQNWLAVSWSAVSWSAVSWSAVSWSAVSWSAVSWSAVSWSAVSWSAVSWSAVSWSAVSWSDAFWGDGGEA